MKSVHLRWYAINYWMDFGEPNESRGDGTDVFLGGIRGGESGWSVMLTGVERKYEDGVYATEVEARAAVEAYWTTPRLVKLRLTGK